MSVHLSVVVPVYNERYLVAESVRRLLAVASPLISQLDVVLINDGSTDGTTEIVRRLASDHPDRITYIEHAINQGKGAAVRSGIENARGTVTVIHDADLEYDPQDLPRLMVPFINDAADAVFGSRFLGSDYRRVLYYRHSLGNKLLTALCSLITDLNLSDMETCYKAVRTRMLQSIPIRSNDFRIEPELTIKLAKRGARIFEVPISYAGRTYEEGKKIGFKDAILAFITMIHWWLIDDLYKPDEYGSNILVSMSSVPNFNRWMADAIRPYVGSRVLEVGAGIGNLSKTLLPRDYYVLSDINPYYIEYLKNFSDGKPYMSVREVNLSKSEDFAALDGQFDTIICLNVLEHIEDENAAVQHLRTALAPGGRAIVLVPQNPDLYGSLDDALGHRCRYSPEHLRRAIESNGLQIEEMFDFNRITTPGWWLNGRLLQRRHFSKIQLKFLNMFTWLFRGLEHILPWHGASLIAVARRPLAEQNVQPNPVAASPV